MIISLDDYILTIDLGDPILRYIMLAVSFINLILVIKKKIKQPYGMITSIIIMIMLIPLMIIDFHKLIRIFT